ncbi:hypothetical protein FRACYDRAFT_235041 [Fragilariopsis cylindrus CCMP1102]|uniref:Uncharacterized protein n=1 Tax=Fragilariopsis cylindrus CCMP1102 TaxID=635003 RepID=A0A1E7FTD6_9STRA|nr:hypothetical protein FRACYDRAFT_235041 [Fragilariopsis cylindrus CCMP1102]|eukprot:OEU21418.1 hypothetical protein FRACYDRAFT_235041 [Fragilariopsis cylindrus CCMP1102]
MWYYEIDSAILRENPSTCTALLLRTTTLTRQQHHLCFRRPNRQQRGEKTATATTDLFGRQRRLSSLSSYQSSSTSAPSPATSSSFKYTAEVVGANGRIGSFWLYRHFLNNDDDDDNNNNNNNNVDTTGTITANKHSIHKSDKKDEDQDQKTNTAVIACPRGSSPGCLTPMGTPIYVATPSDTYLQIYNETIPSRKNDLVFVGNAGIPIPNEFRDCTILVPHFAVLHNNTIASANANASNNEDNKDNDDYDAFKIIVNTDPLKSPPTYLYGRHSTIASKVLETNGIKTEIVNSFEEIQALSGRKLVWASCLWLLCAVTKGSQPLTVEQVHELRQDDLDRLVDDLIPSLQHLLSLDDENNNDNNEQIRKILNKKGINEYLKAYSSSIPNVVPSKALATKEYTERNGIWSSCSNPREGEDQKFHLKLLKRQGIDV